MRILYSEGNCLVIDRNTVSLFAHLAVVGPYYTAFYTEKAWDTRSE